MNIEELEKRIGKLEKKYKANYSEKLFGRYHELALLLIGFIVTSILGGAITFYYQSNQLENQLLLASKLEEKKQKINFYEVFSHQVNQRIFHPHRIYNSIINNEKVNEKKRWDEYINIVLKEWGEKQMDIDIKMDFYFSHSTKTYYDNIVFPRLRIYHQSIYNLDSFYKHNQLNDSALYNKLIKEFNTNKDSVNSNIKKMNKLVYQEINN